MGKKKTEEIQKIVDAAFSKATSKTIRDCSFVGVQFDAQAVSAINTIATGLVENAKALGNLAGVLKASNVTIDAMVKIEN